MRRALVLGALSFALALSCDYEGGLFGLDPDAGPLIGLSSGSVEVHAIASAAAPAAELTVTNAGVGELVAPTTSVTYTSGTGWLTVGVTGATEPYTLDIQADAAALAPGTYEGTITVTCTGVSNSPRIVPVTFHVHPAGTPLIGLDTLTMTFASWDGGPNPADQTFTISNPLEGTLDYTITLVNPDGWLSVASGGGSVASGGPGVGITVSAALGSLGQGTYPASIVITDTNEPDEAPNSPQTIEVVLQILADMTAPSITSTPVTAAQIGVAYTYDVEATGVPEPTYSLDAGALASGLSVDAGTGVITWTPLVGQGGLTDVEVTATNPAGSDVQNFQISVPEAPQIATTAPTAAEVGVAYAYDADASGHPAPTWSLDAAAEAAGVSVYTSTGLVTWTPVDNQGGPQPVTLTATNGSGFDTESFTLVVNEAPTIVSPAGGGVLVAGDPYTYDVSATGYPPPTYTLDATSLGKGIAINGTNGIVTWTPTVAHVGTHDIVVTAANGTLPNNPQLTQVEVFRKPSINSTPATSAVVGTPYYHDVNADGVPAPTFSLDAASLAADLTINNASGVISWTPAPGQGGFQDVTVTATNAHGTDTQDFQIEVTEAPVITSMPARAAAVDATYTYDVEASGHPHTFSLDSDSVALGLGIDAGTGVITWTPSAGDEGIVEVTVSVSNSEGSDQQTYYITVYESDGTTLPLGFASDIKSVDIAYLVDTTGNTFSNISQIQAAIGMSATDVTALVPDSAFGLADFREYPVFVGSDYPYNLVQPIAPGSAPIAASAMSLSIGSGGDWPTPAYTALTLLVTGEMHWNVPTSDMAFRPGALPVVVLITEDPIHTQAEYVPIGVSDAFSLGDATNALTSIGARFVGVPGGTGGYDPTPEMFGIASGVNPADPVVAPLWPTAAAVYNSISAGLQATLYSSRYDMGAVVRRDEVEFENSGLDTSLFVTSVTPTGFVKGLDSDPDPVAGDISGTLAGNDAWLGVTPGATLSFDVSTDPTIVAAQADPQYFTVFVDIVADGVTVVDSIKVTVLVP